MGLVSADSLDVSFTLKDYVLRIPPHTSIPTARNAGSSRTIWSVQSTRFGASDRMEHISRAPVGRRTIERRCPGSNVLRTSPEPDMSFTCSGTTRTRAMKVARTRTWRLSSVRVV